MKSRNKLFLCATLMLAALPVFAQVKNKVTIKEPIKGSAVIVGKVEVINNANKEFYAETFNIPDTDRSLSDVYTRPIPNKNNRQDKGNPYPELYTNGSYFFDVCWPSKKAITYQSLINLYMFTDLSKKFDPVKSLFLCLPVTYKVSFLKDEQYLYIGTIRYYVSSDCSIQKVEVIDEFDQAKKDFSDFGGDPKKLCRSLAEYYIQEK